MIHGSNWDGVSGIRCGRNAIRWGQEDSLIVGGVDAWFDQKKIVKAVERRKGNRVSAVSEA